MTDIRHYSDHELSLLFLNDEFFYKELMRATRREDFSIVEEIANEYFTFDQEQLDNLRETFEQEIEEYNNN
jgi:hypothetical protein